MSEIISPVWKYEESGYPDLNAAEMKFKRINVWLSATKEGESFYATLLDTNLNTLLCSIEWD